MHVCDPAGLASPAALQAPVLSKPKNSSLAISKPQDGESHCAPAPSVTSPCVHVADELSGLFQHRRDEPESDLE